jgi:hypothetical protein
MSPTPAIVAKKTMPMTMSEQVVLPNPTGTSLGATDLLSNVLVEESVVEELSSIELILDNGFELVSIYDMMEHEDR